MKGKEITCSIFLDTKQPVPKGMSKDSGFLRLTPEKSIIYVHSHQPRELHTYTQTQTDQHNQEDTND